jgi:hypothetical protein
MQAFKRLVETMSTHLAILDRARLVVPRRDGRMAFSMRMAGASAERVHGVRRRGLCGA